MSSPRSLVNSTFSIGGTGFGTAAGCPGGSDGVEDGCVDCSCSCCFGLEASVDFVLALSFAFVDVVVAVVDINGVFVLVAVASIFSASLVTASASAGFLVLVAATSEFASSLDPPVAAFFAASSSVVFSSLTPLLASATAFAFSFSSSSRFLVRSAKSTFSSCSLCKTTTKSSSFDRIIALNRTTLDSAIFKTCPNFKRSSLEYSLQ
mmetsp:Transcript_19045/g.28332  ORF Transcript_19045/g.28332 Transcript_19045/m.28332 type:complete len:207 (-) Transcript_19045:997-1617(-)